MDKEHQKLFELIWDRGNFRQGSTALRMSELIKGIIPPGTKINDYGSGTGRVEVNLLKCGKNYSFSMIDIASNALDPEPRSLLGPYLKFTVADLQDLPPEIEKTEWGLCINALMNIKPKMLDPILSEISRTCSNLIFEAYDMDDFRCGYQLSMNQLNKDQWHRKLNEYWGYVRFIQSPESKRRYIFICRQITEECSNRSLSGPHHKDNC